MSDRVYVPVTDPDMECVARIRDIETECGADMDSVAENTVIVTSLDRLGDDVKRELLTDAVSVVSSVMSERVPVMDNVFVCVRSSDNVTREVVAVSVTDALVVGSSLTEPLRLGEGVPVGDVDSDVVDDREASLVNEAVTLRESDGDSDDVVVGVSDGVMDASSVGEEVSEPLRDSETSCVVDGVSLGESDEERDKSTVALLVGEPLNVGDSDTETLAETLRLWLRLSDTSSVSDIEAEELSVMEPDGESEGVTVEVAVGVTLSDTLTLLDSEAVCSSDAVVVNVTLGVVV